MAPLQPGMLISNEPGYYKVGEYGIRIENVVLVTLSRNHRRRRTRDDGFETLTLAPIDRRLIVAGNARKERARLAQRLSQARLRHAGAGTRPVRATLAEAGDGSDLANAIAMFTRDSRNSRG